MASLINSGMNALLPDCPVNGHVTDNKNNAAKLIISYHFNNPAHFFVWINSGTIKQKGLSQTMSQLGEVASWDDTNTRNVMTHPAIPKRVKRIESNQRVTFLRRQSCIVTIAVAVSRHRATNMGVECQGDGGRGPPDGSPSHRVSVELTRGT